MNLMNGNSRIVFNFLDFCNLKCPVCYCPFHGKKSDIEVWKRIVLQIEKLGISIITFGGGEVFHHPDFLNFISWLTKRNTFKSIHIDTNAEFIFNSQVERIIKSIDLIGIAIDGKSNSVHKAIRPNSNLSNSLNLLESVRKLEVKVKVNTVLTKKNLSEIEEMSRMLKNYRVDIWSLYQFWPMERGKINNGIFSITDKEYDDIFNMVKKSINGVLEYGKVKKRNNNYLFVDNIGTVYIIDENDYTRYKVLGSIFNETTTIDILKLNNKKQLRELDKRYN